MPAVAPLEDLERAHREMESLRMKHPDVYADVVGLIERNRAIGYNNLCKMLLGEKTPKELKGLD